MFRILDMQPTLRVLQGVQVRLLLGAVSRQL